MPDLTGLDGLRDAVEALDAARTDLEGSIHDTRSSSVLARNEDFRAHRNPAGRGASAGIIARLDLDGVGPWERVASLLAEAAAALTQSGIPGTRLPVRADSVSAADFPEDWPPPSPTITESPDHDQRWLDPDPYAALAVDRKMIGHILGGRYRLERQLGRGGMGTVYLASDLAAGESPFAVRVLQPEFRSFSEALAMLRAEVRVTRMLRHPHIARVYSLNSDRLDVYLVAEYLDGRTLDSYLREIGKGLAVNQVRPMVDEVCAALAYAHDLEVVHGDLKPANIFITLSGRARLLDFGIARAARTRNGRFDPLRVGGLTMAYTSSEMLEGDEPDPRDDVYSLACIIYTLLSGAHPFDSRSALEARRLNLAMTPLPALSGDQNAALARALSFERARRTPSVTALLASLGWGPEPPAVWPRAVAAAIPFPPAPQPMSPSPIVTPAGALPTAATRTPPESANSAVVGSVSAISAAGVPESAISAVVRPAPANSVVVGPAPPNSAVVGPAPAISAAVASAFAIPAAVVSASADSAPVAPASASSVPASSAPVGPESASSASVGSASAIPATVAAVPAIPGSAIPAATGSTSEIPASSAVASADSAPAGPQSAIPATNALESPIPAYPVSAAAVSTPATPRRAARRLPVRPPLPALKTQRRAPLPMPAIKTQRRALPRMPAIITHRRALPSAGVSRRYLMPAIIVLLLLAVGFGIAFMYRRHAAALHSRTAFNSAPVVANNASAAPPLAGLSAIPPAATPPAVANPRSAAAAHVGAPFPLLRPLPKAAAAMEDSANCQYPRMAVDQVVTGTVLLLVDVASDGSLVKTKIDKTSGFAALDEAAIRCVEEFGRFPVPPGGPGGHWGRVRFTWSFGA